MFQWTLCFSAYNTAYLDDIIIYKGDAFSVFSHRSGSVLNDTSYVKPFPYPALPQIGEA